MKGRGNEEKRKDKEMKGKEWKRRKGKGGMLKRKQCEKKI